MKREERIIKVRYLRTERFTNKNVDIKVQLYEMDMAIVDITVKTAYRYYRRLCDRMNLPWGSRARFDYCKHEALWEYVECLNLLRFDKVARRWLRRVMHPMVAPYLMPKGKMNYRKATDEMERLLCITGEEFVLNAAMLRTVKRHLPELFANGGYRGTDRFGTEITSREPSEPVFKNEKYREYWLRRQRRKRTTTLVCTNERMLALTQELVPDFYALLQRDRKLDDCTVKMRFTWREGLERPILDIIVTDNDSPSYEMEEPREERYGVYHELPLGTMMNYGSLYL